MTKKKTEETMISSEAVENNTEMEEIIDVSEEKTVSADESTAALEEPVAPKKKRATKKKIEAEFKGHVEMKDPAVKVTDTSGKKYTASVVKHDEDDITFSVAGLNLSPRDNTKRDRCLA